MSALEELQEEAPDIELAACPVCGKTPWLYSLPCSTSPSGKRYLVRCECGYEHGANSRRLCQQTHNLGKRHEVIHVMPEESTKPIVEPPKKQKKPSRRQQAKALKNRVVDVKPFIEKGQYVKLDYLPLPAFWELDRPINMSIEAEKPYANAMQLAMINLTIDYLSQGLVLFVKAERPDNEKTLGKINKMTKHLGEITKSTPMDYALTPMTLEKQRQMFNATVNIASMFTRVKTGRHADGSLAIDIQVEESKQEHIDGCAALLYHDWIWLCECLAKCPKYITGKAKNHWRWLDQSMQALLTQTQGRKHFRELSGEFSRDIDSGKTRRASQWTHGGKKKDRKKKR